MAHYDEYGEDGLTIDPNYTAKLALAQAIEGKTWNEIHRGTIYVDLVECPIGTRLDPVHDPLIKGVVALEVINEAGQVKVVASKASGVGLFMSRVDQAVPRISEQVPAEASADTSMSQEMPMPYNSDGSLSGVTARFFVQSVSLLPSDQAKVSLGAACRGPENRTWAKYSPAGNIEMLVHGVEEEYFKARRGKEVRVDFGTGSLGGVDVDLTVNEVILLPNAQCRIVLGGPDAPGLVTMSINNPAAEVWWASVRGQKVTVSIADRDPICDRCHQEVPTMAAGVAYDPVINGYSDFDTNGAARFVCARCKTERDAEEQASKAGA